MERSVHVNVIKGKVESQIAEAEAAAKVGQEMLRFLLSQNSFSKGEKDVFYSQRCKAQKS